MILGRAAGIRTKRGKNAKFGFAKYLRTRRIIAGKGTVKFPIILFLLLTANAPSPIPIIIPFTLLIRVTIGLAPCDTIIRKLPPISA